MSEKQDPLDLEAIEGRLKAATPGPWEWSFTQDGEIMGLATKTEYVIDPYESWGISVLKIDKGNAEFIPNAPTDIAALVAEVKRLRLACDIAESGEVWWKGVAIIGFMNEDEGKRVVEELDKLREEYTQHTANLNRIIDSNHRETWQLQKELTELKRTQVKDGGRGRLRSFPEPDDRITTAD